MNIMTGHEVDNVWVAKLLSALRRDRTALVRAFQSETGYSSEDAELLFEAATQFIGELSCTKPLLRAQWRAADRAPFIAKVPWGRVLITVPANAALPLGVILPTAFAHAGNEVVVCGNRQLHGTNEQVARVFEDALVPVRWAEHDARSAVARAIRDRNVDLIYSVGGSRHFPGFAQMCAEAGIDLIFEGEGGGSAVFDVLEASHLKQAVVSLVEAKRRWRGQMCSSPLVAYVHASQVEAFTRALDEALKQHSWGEQRPVALSRAARCHIADIERINRLPSSDWEAPLAHVTAVGPAEKGDLFATDVFGPVFFYRVYYDRKGLASELSRSPYGLQTTIYSRDEQFVSSLLAEAKVARVCVNRLPVLQDPLRPWGGYRKSGRSDTTSFIEKAYRRVIVESD